MRAYTILFVNDVCTGKEIHAREAIPFPYIYIFLFSSFSIFVEFVFIVLFYAPSCSCLSTPNVIQRGKLFLPNEQLVVSRSTMQTFALDRIDCGRVYSVVFRSGLKINYHFDTLEYFFLTFFSSSLYSKYVHKKNKLIVVTNFISKATVNRILIEISMRCYQSYDHLTRKSIFT